MGFPPFLSHTAQDESRTLLKVTSGQVTLHFGEILASDTTCFRLWLPTTPPTRLPSMTCHLGPVMPSTCERGHSFAKELWFISFSKSFSAFLTVVWDHCSGGRSSSLGQLLETQIRKGIMTRLHPAAEHSFKTDRFHFAHQTDASGDCSRSPDCSD